MSSDNPLKIDPANTSSNAQDHQPAYGGDPRTGIRVSNDMDSISWNSTGEVNQTQGINWAARSADNPQQAGGDILATAKTRGYASVIKDIDETNTLVTLPNGMEVPVGDAVKHGYLERDGYGGFYDPATPQRRQQAQEQRAAEAKEQRQQAELLPLEQEQDIQSIEKDLGPLALSQIASRAFVKGPEAAVANLPGADGEYQQRIGKLMQGFQVQADRAVSESTNLDTRDLPAFWSWARMNANSELYQAYMDQVLRRSTQGYKQLAERFTQKYGDWSTYLQQQGYEVKRDSNSRALTVKVNGSWMSLDAAVRMRFVA